jgi:hypothetical protein
VITDLISFSESLCSLFLNSKGFFSPVEIKPKAEPVIASLKEVDNWEMRRGELKSQLNDLHNLLNGLKGRTSRTTSVLSPSHLGEAILTRLISLLLINNVTTRP